MKRSDWKKPCWAMDKNIWDDDNGVYYDQRVWIAGVDPVGRPILCDEDATYDPQVAVRWDDLEICKTKKDC